MNAPVRASGAGRKSRADTGRKSSITRAIPPDELHDANAITLWKQQSKILIKRGTFEPEDGPVLLAYCNAFSLMLKCDQTILDEGVTTPTADSIKKHPAVAVRNDAVSQMARLGSLLGLDPLSRTRFMSGGPSTGNENQGNEFDEF